MNELVCIKAKSPKGDILTLRVQQILEIDGEPYVQTSPVSDLAAYVVDHEQRIAALEERFNDNR